MTLTEAKTLIDEWCYENKHNIITSYYSGDLMSTRVEANGPPPIELETNKAVVVIVDRFEEEFIDESRSNLTIIAVKKDDFWVSVLAYAGFDLGGDIGGFDFVLTKDKKLRRKSQCVKENNEFKCIANPPAIPLFESITDVMILIK